MTTLITVALSSIDLEAGTQARAAVSNERVAEYAQLYADGTEMDPVSLIHDGERYYPVDGFHRIAARMRAGFTDVAALVEEGSKEDAVWASFGANARHGLARTNEDKRRAVIGALLHARGAEQSNRTIAAHVGVSRRLVDKIKHELVAGGELPEPDSVIGADGKVYTLKVEDEEQAGEAPSPFPSGCRTVEQRRDHVGQLTSSAALDALLAAEDLQESVKNFISYRRGVIADIEKAGNLREVIKALGWRTGDEVFAEAAAIRLGELTAEAEQTLNLDQDDEELLALVPEIDLVSECDELLAQPHTPRIVRRRLLPHRQALDGMNTWRTPSEDAAPGLHRAHARLVAEAEAEKARIAAEHAWLRERIALPAAQALDRVVLDVPPGDLKANLKTWLRWECGVKDEVFAEEGRAEVRHALAQRVQQAGVELLACPVCPHCYMEADSHWPSCPHCHSHPKHAVEAAKSRAEDEAEEEREREEALQLIADEVLADRARSELARCIVLEIDPEAVDAVEEVEALLSETKFYEASLADHLEALHFGQARGLSEEQLAPLRARVLELQVMPAEMVRAVPVDEDLVTQIRSRLQHGLGDWVLRDRPPEIKLRADLMNTDNLDELHEALAACKLLDMPGYFELAIEGRLSQLQGARRHEVVWPGEEVPTLAQIRAVRGLLDVLRIYANDPKLLLLLPMARADFSAAIEFWQRQGQLIPVIVEDAAGRAAK